MLKVRNILFWKYIPNIQSDYGNNSDSSLFTSNMSILKDKSIIQLKEYRLLLDLFQLSTINHYDSSNSWKSFALCILIMTGSIDLFP